MAGHGGNVIHELKTDHREIEALFARIRSAATGTERKELLDEVTVELVRHSVAEEAHLYPAVRDRVPAGEVLADKEVEDHARVERLLKAIESTAAEDPALPGLAATLIEEVTSHIQEEERELFLALQAACDDEELDRLGDRIRRAKATAPTRPHPGAPSSPAARRVLAPGVGLVDRVRDHLTGRPGA
ncbi:hemerythrin domain-containing protein [Kitasatospora cheerisanensis]|uniref:Hemerythrin n=1 Tax=Kitasatospora cheerisanensis KCTC 2395 TaxID=1348663 RepID=A0A066YHY2_9ACTN|nr:hemerythrin domain-containing protein [Kitasatospora cheerisanensis]KDN80732.1 hemerythrin [Kitasatospora cheerisanensis KCTC 2395]